MSHSSPNKRAPSTISTIVWGESDRRAVIRVSLASADDRRYCNPLAVGRPKPPSYTHQDTPARPVIAGW